MKMHKIPLPINVETFKFYNNLIIMISLSPNTVHLGMRNSFYLHYNDTAHRATAGR